MKLGRDKKGFTLIELIIIIIILGILAAVAIPKYLDMRKDAADATVKGILGGMRGANSVLWGNRVINSQTTTYSFVDIIANMELRGGNMQITWDAGGTNLTVNVASSPYYFTMGIIPGGTITWAMPPTQYVQISALGTAATW